MFFLQANTGAEEALLTGETQQKESLSIMQLIFDGGLANTIIIGVLFLMLAVTIYIYFERTFAISAAKKIDTNFMNVIRDNITSGRIEAAKNLCFQYNSPIARLVSKGISRIGRPIDDIHKAIENTGSLEVYKLEKNDTLAKIAKKYGISVVDIVDYNNINPKKLKAGSTIFLKGVTLQKYKDVEGRLIATQQAKEDKKKNKEKEKEKPEKPPKEAKGSAPPPPPPQDDDDGGKSAAYSGVGFAYPVRYAGVSSPFGNRYHPVLKRYILHTGVDLVAKYVPLRAAKAGVVTFAGNMSGYGKIIIIRHDNGYETRYAHLSVISTNVGEHVNQGDLIGKTGNSGRTTGAHLHFEIRHNGVPKNPMKYLR